MNVQGIELFKFDRRNMSTVYYVPLLVWCVSVLLIWQASNEIDSYMFSFVVIQGIFIPFSCWHVLFRYSDLFEDGAFETLSPYYQKYVWLDLVRYTLLNWTAISLLLVMIYFKFGSIVFSWIHLVHLTLLVVFYVCVGLTLILLCKSIEIALTIISIYTVIEVVTQGTFMPWPRIFIFLPPYWDVGMQLKFVFIIICVVVMLISLPRLLRRN